LNEPGLPGPGDGVKYYLPKNLFVPVNKNALLRYRIIDGCLTNKNRKYPTTQFILDKIEEQLGEPVSESSFNKDLARMKEIYTAPIRFDRTHGGYYYDQEGFSIKEFPLSNEEIEALDYSTALLQQLKGTRMFQQFENAINKVIEGYRISKVIGKAETQIIQVEEPVKMEGSEWLEPVLKAIVEKNALAVTYQGFGREAVVHEFSPYLLKEYRNRWYMIGYSLRKENVIVLALDRVKEIKTSKQKFKSQTEFSPTDFFRYSFGITQMHDARPEKVVLAFSPQEMPYIIGQPLHHSQKVVAEEPELIIELEVYITAELKMAILSYGKEVRVVEPAGLKKEIAESIKEMALKYQ
jgi:predicted DNA-binding transcriptional regulator YafY